MNYTPNLNLKKPAKTDPVLIDDLNDNMDILDQEIDDLNDNMDILDQEIDALWQRVDSLSAPVLISDGTYAERAVIPLSIENLGSSLYALETLSILSASDRQYAFVRGNRTGSGRPFGAYMSAGAVHTMRTIGPSNPNSMEFYASSGDAGISVYVSAVYLVKEGL